MEEVRLSKSEVSEQPERARAIHGLQATIDDIMFAATREERDRFGSQFTVSVETPVLPGIVRVGCDLDPSKEPRYGIEWEYQVNVVLPLDELGSGEFGCLDTYYFITTDGDAVKLTINEDDYMSPPAVNDILSVKNKFELMEWVDRSAELYEQMDTRIRLEIELGRNGQPAPLDEIVMLNMMLRDATIRPAQSELSSV